MSASHSVHPPNSFGSASSQIAHAAPALGDTSNNDNYSLCSQDVQVRREPSGHPSEGSSHRDVRDTVADWLLTVNISPELSEMGISTHGDWTEELVFDL